MPPLRGSTELSRLKAHSVIESGALEEYPADRMIVVACDSVLNLDGRILGKPHTAERARQWWRRMRGHQGVLVSGHHVAVIVNGQLRVAPNAKVIVQAAQPGTPAATVPTGGGL